MCMNVCVCVCRKFASKSVHIALNRYCMPIVYQIGMYIIIYIHMDHQLVEYEHHMFEPFI